MLPGVDRICEKIINDANEKADRHIRNAEAEAAQLIAEQQRKALEDREIRLQKALAEAERMKERIIAIEQLEFKKQRLQMKQDMITRAFDMALDKFAQMPDRQYRQLIVEMALPLIKSGDEELIISANDKQRLAGIDVEINKRLVEKGISGSVALSDKDGKFFAGFILKRGRMEINNTIETLLKTKREDLERAVAEILFD